MRLNFLLTDGRALFVSRWNRSLYWVERLGVHDCEICGTPHIHHEGADDYRAVVVASEPITDEPWRPLPEDRSMLVVDGGLDTRILRL